MKIVFVENGGVYNKARVKVLCGAQHPHMERHFND